MPSQNEDHYAKGKQLQQLNYKFKGSVVVIKEKYMYNIAQFGSE